MSNLFDTVLIANRGEIAVRIMRTLRRLGIRSIAVYSDADRGARHVADADVAVRLGASSPRDSYLHSGRILDVAAATGAQAIHPGYGFLAENAEFARACHQADVAFIGPSPHAIALMGDKIRAKQTVAAAGVPVLPGRIDIGMSDIDLVSAAEEIGYPVLVKPSAGGGGKGMRVVTSPGELMVALVSARREAESSFGDDTLFLERLVLRPRHIEVQVLADNFGTTLDLGERECSLQRRHQKVVEESPSPLIDGPTRARLGEASVATARSVGYTGAGTIEFIVSADQPDQFFFMEMNTRLQVEHPVTELVTGLDLVEQQLRVAAGEPLGFGPADVKAKGHAVEARVYAEDPDHGFLPTGGRVLMLREPTGDGIRVDNGLLEGHAVATSYDPLLMKVIAWGPDRSVALSRLRNALAQTVLLGVVSNISFLHALVSHPDVKAGHLDTGLIERELDTLSGHEPSSAAYATYALSRLLDAWPSGSVINPWDLPNGWRAGRNAPLTFTISQAGLTPCELAISGTPEAATLRIGEDEPLPISIEVRSDGFLITVAGTTQSAWTVADGSARWVSVGGRTWRFTEVTVARMPSDADRADQDVRSPMPGVVVELRAASNDYVHAGQPLVVVEAMKMEHVLVASGHGRVELLIGVGDQVRVDEVVAHIRSEDGPSEGPEGSPQPPGEGNDPATPMEA